MTPTFAAHSLDSTFPPRLRQVSPVPDMVEATGALAGALSSLGPTVAIVGTRLPPPAAAAYARWFASELAKRGVVVLSGGAFGIDAAAHEGAISTGRSICVLPGGVDVAAPPSHRELLQRIEASGALVAIRPRGTVPQRHYYLQRNAVIAALADHVVVIAAPIRSGARNTAMEARRLGRPLWCVPGAPWDARTAGSALELCVGGARPLVSPDPLLHALGRPMSAPTPDYRCALDDEEAQDGPHPSMRLGARQAVGPKRTKPASLSSPMRSQSSTPAIESTLFVTKASSPSPSTEETFLPAPEERRVLETLRERGRVGIDELVLTTGLGVGPLRGLLLTWTVEGVVREGPPGLFSLANH